MTGYRYRVSNADNDLLGDFADMNQAIQLARKLNAVVWKYIPPKGLWAKKVEIHATA